MSIVRAPRSCVRRGCAGAVPRAFRFALEVAGEQNGGMIRTKRAYEPAANTDGYRVLVDRLWPRGVSKDAARIDGWLKDLAPSQELRTWFAHDPSRFPEFRARYEEELTAEPAAKLLADLAQRARRGHVTLVYAAHDELHNNAVVLAEELERRLRAGAKAASRAKSRTAPKAPAKSRPKSSRSKTASRAKSSR